jgi:hypothetical protein
LQANADQPTRTYEEIQKYFEHFVSTRCEILERCTWEFTRGEVQHDSLHNVIQALEDPTLKEVIATSDSSIWVWFVPEMICYITAQIKTALVRSIPVKRYILEDSGEVLHNKKLSSPRIQYDTYGVFKEMHRNTMQLFKVEKSQIPKSNSILLNGHRSFLVLKFKNKQSTNVDIRLWMFTFMPESFNYAFMEIPNVDEQKSIINFIETIEKHPNLHRIV